MGATLPQNQRACNAAKLDYSWRFARASILRRSPPCPTRLGHSVTRVTEKHYDHLSPSHVADMLRADLPRIGGPDGRETVVRSRPSATLDYQAPDEIPGPADLEHRAVLVRCLEHVRHMAGAG